MSSLKKPVSILFACGGLKIGGVQKSLIALIGELLAEEFEITLLVNEGNHALSEAVPEHVRVVGLPREIAEIPMIGTDLVVTARRLIRSPRIFYPLVKYLAERPRRRKVLNERLWLHLAPRHRHHLRSTLGSFDMAIAFAGFQGVWNQIVVDSVQASHKVIWVHGDLSRLATNTTEESRILSKVDSIITVSNECSKIVESLNPQFAGRIHVVHNIVSEVEVRRQAGVGSESGCRRDGAEDCARPVQLVSVGRLDPAKGYWEGIRAFADVVLEGLEAKWTIVGDGPDRNRLESEISAHGLSDRVLLAGSRANPLTYVAEADFFFHPSKSEGHSIAVEEARALGKPVLATNYSTVADQVVDDVDGLVVGFEHRELVAALRRMISDKEMRARLTAGTNEREAVPNPIDAFLTFVDDTLNS